MNWLKKLRISWVLMFGILLVSLLGANKIMHAPRPLGQTERQPPGGDKAAARVAVVATGVIAPEGDIVPLIPSVKGEVVQVLVKTDDMVKKGQLLLKMDDRHARIKLARAESAVKNAELLVEKAKKGLTEWDLGRQAQVLMIEIRRKEHEGMQEKVAKLKELVEKKLEARHEPEYLVAKKSLEGLLLAIQAEEKKLAIIDGKKPTTEIEQAKVGLKDATDQREEARLGLDLCELRAPADGTIMHARVAAGDKFGEQAVKPAFLFYEGGLIVKADLNQEWAHRVKEGQSAIIHDAGGSGITWKGKVVKLGKSFLPKRDASGGIEGVNLLQQTQEPVLECRIALDPNQPATPFLNQKVRVHLGQ